MFPTASRLASLLGWVVYFCVLIPLGLEFFTTIKTKQIVASAVQMVSALLKEGPDYLSRVCAEMASWMEEKEYESLEEMRGSMNLLRCPDPKALSRANYMHVLHIWEEE